MWNTLQNVSIFLTIIVSLKVIAPLAIKILKPRPERQKRIFDKKITVWLTIITLSIMMIGLVLSLSAGTIFIYLQQINNAVAISLYTIMFLGFGFSLIKELKLEKKKLNQLILTQLREKQRLSCL